MNKFLFIIPAFLASFSAYAEAYPFNGGVEARAAAFIPTSDAFRRIYGTASAAFAIEAVYKLKNPLFGFANIDWLSKDGRSIGLHNFTSLKTLNTSFGLKLAHPFWENCYPYIGLGPNISVVWIHNHSHCAKEQSKASVGLVAKSGLYIVLPKQLFLDVFVDYLYQPYNFSKHADIGGFKIGLGFGGRF